MPSWLMGLFRHYGYLVIVLAVLMENAGIPAPGHTVLLAAGFLAHQQQLSLKWVITTGALAAMVGDNIGYWIGRRRGRDFLERHCRRLHMSAPRLHAIDDFFARHGPKTVFIARFVTGLQTVAALFAGVSRMPWRSFFFYNLTGALVWASIYACAGYLFGASWKLLEKWVGRSGLFLLLIIVIAVIAAAWMRTRHRAVRPRFSGRVSREAVFSFSVLAFFAIFAKIAEEVVHHENNSFDHAAKVVLGRLDSPFLDTFTNVFLQLGSAPAAVLVIIVVAVLCLKGRRYRELAVLLSVAVFDGAATLILKEIFAPGFPSVHVVTVTALYGISAVILARLFPRHLPWAGIGVPLLIAAIGFARTFLEADSATAVLAGIAAGMVILLAGVYALGEKR